MSELTLTEFLLARIAEDEARAARPDDDGPSDSWHTRDCGVHPQGVERTWCTCDVPSQLLARCAAHRRIVEEHATLGGDLGGDLGDECRVCVHDHPCVTLRALASVYADHPDFQEAWRV